MSRSLEAKIESRQARIGILGLGYVGLPLAVEFARSGFRVTGFDVDAKRVEAVRRGRSYVPDVPSQALREFAGEGRLAASTGFGGLRSQDAVVICVPTPLRKTRDPDVSYIVAATDEAARRLRPGQLIVLESTTYPGTTREMLLPRLESGGLREGRDFFLAFSPERVDPGNRDYRIPNTPKVVGGVSARAGALAVLLYSKVVREVVPVSDCDTAEMVKLLENTFRAVNIGLINEVATMCDRLGLDVWEVIEAAKTKPFGFMPFYPGPGIGGHCIPTDPEYLAWKMKALNFEPRFIELASAVNASMPRHVMRRVSRLLNERSKPVRGSKLLVLGVAYKADVGDVRESPAVDVIALLAAEGAVIRYHDPFVPRLKVGARTLASAPFGDGLLKWADCVAILTAHSALDYRKVVAGARLVFDARNATKGLAASHLRRL